MDDNTRRRRQYEPPNPATSNTRYAVHDPNAQRRSYGTGAPERYRPAPLNTSPSAARGMGGTASYSGYYQEPATTFSTAMPQSTMTYQPGYGQDNRQTQSFNAYAPTMIYDVPQTGAQNTVYDTNQQFPSRTPAGLQMMPTDVAAPYFPSEPNNATPSMQPQAGSSSSSAVYQQSPADQRTMLQNYSSGIASMSGMAQPSAPEQVVEEQDYSGSAEMGEAYEQYQSALKEIFTNIRGGVLQAASESLLNVSEWLLSKVVELGLAGDNPGLHHDRIKLWHDFNHAWLALGQKQKDMMESGLPPQRGQSLVGEEGLNKMAKELARLCDGIERHGLVDYEYGVWEEHIMDILIGCLELYDNVEEGSASNPSGSSHPNHHTSR
ncbi:hypothetical protein F5Y15DRAFT_92026 [Xylariaceae sp. FL0016]|nr:hypothetical protein F5Y15DRAFT_92026 [Xylariaceae sp. FL0016]